MKYFTLLLLSVSAFASTNWPIRQPSERFFKRLQFVEYKIDQMDRNASFEDKAKFMDDDDLRDRLNELEALFELYDKDFDSFEDLGRQTKAFEDQISHYRDVLGYQSKPELHNAMMDARYAKETQEYKDLLEDSAWFEPGVPLANDIRDAASKLDKHDLEKDRNFLLKKMAKHFEARQDKEYDLSLLEEGIHELRRDTRRLQFFNDALDGMIVADETMPCPIGSKVGEGRAHGGEDYACPVSSCVLDKIQEVNKNMSKLRGMAYEDFMKGLPLAQSITDQAESVLADLKDSKAFLHLSAQLLSCRSSNKD